MSKSLNVMADRKNCCRRRRVQFSTTEKTFISDTAFYAQRKKDELKSLWYSRAELVDTCQEAKGIIKMIHLAGGKLDSIDHTQHCVVGLEKFQGKKEREKYRKLLVRAVLIRQEMNRGMGLPNESLSEISKMMSASFRDYALWQAALHKLHASDAHNGSSTATSSTVVSTTTASEKECLNDGTTETMQTTSKKRARTASGHTQHNHIMSSSEDLTVVDNPVQTKPEVLRREMSTVMEGYVERKRLRSQVHQLIPKLDSKPCAPPKSSLSSCSSQGDVQTPSLPNSHHQHLTTSRPL